MASSKIAAFTVEQNNLAKWCKALSHPARIAILEYLSKVEGCFCGDIVEELPLSQSTVSQHLKALKEAGFIQGITEGVKTCYCIDRNEWNKIKSQIELFLSKEHNCC